MNIQKKLDELMYRQPVNSDGYIEFSLRTAIQDAVEAFGSEGVRLLSNEMINDFVARKARS